MGPFWQCLSDPRVTWRSRTLLAGARLLGGRPARVGAEQSLDPQWTLVGLGSSFRDPEHPHDPITLATERTSVLLTVSFSLKVHHRSQHDQTWRTKEHCSASRAGEIGDNGPGLVGDAVGGLSRRASTNLAASVHYTTLKNKMQCSAGWSHSSAVGVNLRAARNHGATATSLKLLRMPLWSVTKKDGNTEVLGRPFGILTVLRYHDVGGQSMSPPVRGSPAVSVPGIQDIFTGLGRDSSTIRETFHRVIVNLLLPSPHQDPQCCQPVFRSTPSSSGTVCLSRCGESSVSFDAH